MFEVYFIIPRIFIDLKILYKISLSIELELYLLKISLILSFFISLVYLLINLLIFFIPSKLHSDKNIFVESFNKSFVFKKFIFELSKIIILKYSA